MRVFFKFIFLFTFLVSQVYANYRPSHLRVIWHENPLRHSIISWTTDKLCQKSTIYFDKVSRRREVSKYKFKLKSKRKMFTGTLDMRHSVELDGLDPDSTYYFVIEKDGVVSREYHFKTASLNSGESYKLLFGGDSRSDRETRRKVNKLIKNLVETNPNLIALVHGGDYIENGMSWKQWKGWLEDYQGTISTSGRVLPIIPTRGNHEYFSPLYNDVFKRPGKKLYKNYFTTKFKDLSIITLNTNISFSGHQKKWLKSQLQSSVKDSKWIFTNYHRPAYPAVKKPGGALKHWVPLFEKYLVDLAFESDGHTLKKTVPIFKGQVNLDKGIIYIGEGGMGVKQRVPTRKNEWYLQSPGYAESKHHVILVNVSDEKVDVDVRLLDGSSFDKFTLKPRKRL